MGTEFTNERGELVARRYWGGEFRGTVVELQRGAATTDRFDLLRGDDGSTTTLAELAEHTGTNGKYPACVIDERPLRPGPSPRPGPSHPLRRGAETYRRRVEEGRLVSVEDDDARELADRLVEAGFERIGEDE